MGPVVMVVVILVHVAVLQLQVPERSLYLTDVVTEEVLLTGRVVVGFAVGMREATAVLRDVIDGRLPSDEVQGALRGAVHARQSPALSLRLLQSSLIANSTSQAQRQGFSMSVRLVSNSWPQVIHSAQSPKVLGLQTGFHHVGQAGLELPTSGDPPALASKVLGLQTIPSSWDYRAFHHAQLIFNSFVKTDFCLVAQPGLKFLVSSDLLTSTSQSAGITGISHHTRLNFQNNFEF
ncbi:Zinc finger protein, partial [Plecturocebus cupreus]